MATVHAQSFLHELNAEYKATLACLERIPEKLFEYQPHPKSMKMGCMSAIVYFPAVPACRRMPGPARSFHTKEDRARTQSGRSKDTVTTLLGRNKYAVSLL